VKDIPGAFLHANMEQDVHMLLEGTIAEMIVRLEPSLYRKFLWKKQTRQTYPVCKTKEGMLWDITSSITILEAIV
jgi:hypothetical protein